MNTGADHTSDYRALSIITKALIGGVLLFSAISLVIHFVQGAFIKDENLSKTISIILVLISSFVIGGARLIYAKRTNSLMATNQTVREKLDIFRAITVTHMALCEMPAILSIALFICFGNFLLFLVVGMAIVEMVKKFPSQHRIESVVHSGTF